MMVGGVAMGGGMMGGSGGDYGLAEPVGIIGAIRGIFSFLPNWLATLMTALILLLLAMLVGWIVGKVVGGILYPNPDKQSLLNQKQKFAVLGASILLFGITIFALNYKEPVPDEFGSSMPVGGEMTPEGEEMLPEGEDAEGMTPEGESDESSAADGEAEADGAGDGEQLLPDTDAGALPPATEEAVPQ